MSTLKLKGSTSGYVELTAPATAGDNQIVLPTTAGTVAVKDASGNTEVGTGVTIGSPSSNVFTVSTNGSERVRVNSSGNVGIGTDTPATTNGAVGKLVTVYSSGNNVISGESTAGVGYGLILEGRYDGRSGNERYSQVNLKTDDSNNGQFTVSLAAAGGDVSERANFTINGLTFNGDTAAANALDDYEEGSWTPNVSGGGVSWLAQIGRYTKIGNLVVVNFWLQAAGTSSSSGIFSITGLPFALLTVDTRPAGAIRAYQLANFTGKSGVMGWSTNGSTEINPAPIDGNGLTEGTTLNHNVWQTGAELHCTLSYQTA